MESIAKATFAQKAFFEDCGVQFRRLLMFRKPSGRKILFLDAVCASKPKQAQPSPVQPASSASQPNPAQPAQRCQPSKPASLAQPTQPSQPASQPNQPAIFKKRFPMAFDDWSETPSGRDLASPFLPPRNLLIRHRLVFEVSNTMPRCTDQGTHD